MCLRYYRGVEYVMKVFVGGDSSVLMDLYKSPKLVMFYQLILNNLILKDKLKKIKSLTDLM